MRTGSGRLQLSWLAVALATTLSVTTPAAARLAGERAAAAPRSTHVAVAAVAVEATMASATVGSTAEATRFTQAPVTRLVGADPGGEGARGPAPTAEAPQSALLVHARAGLVAHRYPSASSRPLGTVATASKYYGVPMVLWVEEVNARGTWGLVELPYVWPRREGWIPLRGLERGSTWVRVEVDLSAHTVRVFKRDAMVLKVAGATGAPASPTPPGDYVVTDRVPFAQGSSLGSFAFGISGIQPDLPAGWSGGNQLAIHGTNQPWSIGHSASAGCVRVSEWVLERLKPLLRLGTPVLIRP